MSRTTATRSEQRAGSQPEPVSIQKSPRHTMIGPAGDILELEETLGNRATAALVRSLVPSTVQSTVNSNGQPLEPGLRADMESRFGQDFRDVRIHTDSHAAAAAETMRAKAYTVGRDIVFSEHRYAPDTGEGRRLLAHELAHVIQQSRGGAAPALDPSSSVERAADTAATGFVQGGSPIAVHGASGVGVARDEDKELPYWKKVLNPVYQKALKVLPPEAAQKLEDANEVARRLKEKLRVTDEQLDTAVKQAGPLVQSLNTALDKPSVPSKPPPPKVPPAHKPKPGDPARQVPVVQVGSVGTFGEATITVTGFSATQFAPDPEGGYNFDTYLITPSGKVVPAKHLGGTRYQVFMGSPECPGCHFGRGITVDLHGDPFLLPLADALSMGMGATEFAEWGIGKTTPPAAGGGKSFVMEGGTAANDVLPPNVIPLKRPAVAQPQPGQWVQTGTGGWVFEPGSVPAPTGGPALRIDPITNVAPGGGGAGLPPLLPAPGVMGPAGTSATQADSPSPAPKEQRLADLERRRADTQAKIDELDKQLGKKGGDVGRLSGALKKAQGTDRDRIAQEYNTATAERNQLQDQRNRLQTEKDRIQAEINEINTPPPANPQAGGRAFEKGNVKATGMPKNEESFETPFGDRKPDHVVTADKDGNWIRVKEIGKADFIAESKLLGRNITLTDQVRGFIVLAGKTKQKVLLLLTDPGAVISETVHEFARQQNVRIRQMTRVP